MPSTIRDAVGGHAAPGHQDRQVEVGVDLRQRGRIGQVGLGQHQHRVQIAGVRRDQAAVDEAGARHRIGQRADDHQLVGVGHQHPFGRVGVVRRPAQHTAPRRDPDDPGQGVRRAVGVADQVDQVADRDRPAAEFAGPHRRHHVRPSGALLDQAGVAPAVDGGDEAADRVGVASAWSWSAAGTPRVGRTRTSSLSQFSPRVLSCATPGDGVGRLPSMRAHMPSNPGNVFAVVAMSSTRRRRPAARRSPRRSPSGGRRRQPRSRRAAGRGVIVRESASSSTCAAESGDVGGDRGQPVGLVAAQVADAAQPAGPSANSAMAAIVGVSSPTSCRSTSMPLQGRRAR